VFRYISKVIWCSNELFSNVVSVLGTTALEKEIAEYLLSLGKIPIGWEEALFNSKTVGSLFYHWKSQIMQGLLIGSSRNGFSRMVIS